MNIAVALKSFFNKELCQQDGSRLIWDNHHKYWGTCPICNRLYWHEREFDGPEILRELRSLDLMVCNYQAAFCGKCRRLMEIGEPMYHSNVGKDICFSCGTSIRT